MNWSKLRRKEAEIQRIVKDSIEFMVLTKSAVELEAKSLEESYCRLVEGSCLSHDLVS